MKPIVLLGEAMGTNEVRIGAGFVGQSGVELLRMIDEAGIIDLSAEDHTYISNYYRDANPLHLDCVWQMHPEVLRMNVFNLHPPANDMASLYGEKEDAIKTHPKHIGGKTKKTGYIRKEFASELERLGDDLLKVDPNIIIALGNTPLWALCGASAITKVRGTTRLTTHIVSGFKVLPTIHPAGVINQWEYRPTVLADLMKAKREAEYPEIRRPKREIWIEPTLEDIERFINDHVLNCEILSIDIETAGNQITCIGLAPSPRVSLVIPFYDGRRAKRSYWASGKDEQKAWRLLSAVLGDASVKKLFQNGLYDIAFIWRSVGIKVYGAEHDTMLLHHALQPESLKNLGFLGSIYSDEGSWKQDRKGTTTIKRDE